MSDAIATRKTALRREMRGRLATLDAGERRRASRAIVARLVALPPWRAARLVALFAPLAGEPDLDLLWETGALAGKTVAYPRVTGGRLPLCAVAALTDLTHARWGLREPGPGCMREFAPEEFDLILVPGLAFTPQGLRLGRGGGYYDRLLEAAGTRPCRVGVGFACQMLGELPAASHDARMDLVLNDGSEVGLPPGDQLHQDHDDRDDQQDVDEPSNGVEPDETEQPQHD